MGLGGVDGGAGLDPVNSEVVVGVGKSGAGLARQRRLAAGVVGFPGDPREALDGVPLWGEGRIHETRAEAGAEGRLVELRIGHPLAGLRHRATPGRSFRHRRYPRPGRILSSVAG